ncbi:hypothetical protein AURDEDRAFT_155201 [Auricularia subglabra TFB-10046 SS5]|nr:hypothetical protein AURDEDRAFT_155201 [Auricularia subglabra TFB-10046 SS5]
MVVFSSLPGRAGPTSNDPPPDAHAIKEHLRLMRFGSFIGNNGSIADDVWTNVLPHLNLADLGKLRLVSKSLCRMVSIELKIRFVNLLRCYFTTDERAAAFRNFLDATGSVIGGAEALRFVRPGAWESNNLDVFTPAKRGKQAADFLIALGGVIVPRLQVPHPGVYLFLDHRRDTLSVTVIELNGKHIHVIESRTGSAFHAVLDGWSTALMNIVTPRFAVVAFPHMTFEGLGLFHNTRCQGVHNVSLETLRKYTECGFQHFDTTIYGDFGSVCMSNWWSADKKDRVCVVPFDYTESGIPAELADNLSWRISSVCRVVGCPHTRDEVEEDLTELAWYDLLRE